MALFSRAAKKNIGQVSFPPILFEQAKQDERYQTWIRNHRWTTRSEKWCRARLEKFTYRPTIGILMQCVNPQEELLHESLGSIFNQIYPFSELSLVDRGSSEKIKSVLATIEKDSRVKVSYQKGSERDLDAIAKIMKKAVQEWLLLMGAEDVLEPNALYNMVAYLQNTSEIDFVFSDSDVIDDQGLRFDPQFKPIWAVGASYPLGYYQHPVLLSRRQVEKLKGYERISALMEEGTLLDEASNHSRYVVQAPGVLYHARARSKKNEKPPAAVDNVLINENFIIENGSILINTELRSRSEPKVPLNILWMVDSLDQDDGPTTWFHYARYLSNESGHQFTVVAPKDGMMREPYSRIGRVEIGSEGELDSMIDALHARSKFDVAFVDSIRNFRYPEVISKLNIPSVWHLYAEEFGEMQNLKKTFASVETILFLSSVVAQKFKELDARKVSRILPSGVDLAGIKIFKQRNSPFDLRAKFGLRPNTRLFTIAGPTIERKGQHCFVQGALEALHRNGDKDVKFFIVGERPGSYLNDLKGLIAGSDKADYFHLLPETTDVFQYYPHYLIADVVVSCSKEEIFPLNLLEAMAMKKAVIGTNVFATNEVIEHEENGFLIQPDDPAELAERIDFLLNKPDFFDFFGRRSLEIIYEKFQFRKIATRFEDLLRESIVSEV